MGRAFAIAVLAMGLLSAMDALIKAQAASFPSPQIALLRFFFGSLVVLAAIGVIRPPWPRLETVLANGWRAVLAAGTAILFFYALGRLPLAEVIALSLLSPALTVFFGALLLRESVSRPIVLAVIVGLAGVLVIVVPKFAGPSLSLDALWGTVAVLLSTVTYSLSLVLLRSRAMRDHPLMIVAVQNIGSATLLALLLPVTPGAWHPLTAADLPGFGLLGILGTAGHLFLTKAYGMAPAARMATADYTALVFAAVFGLVFFAEIPSWTTIAGAGLIVTSSFAATRQ